MKTSQFLTGFVVACWVMLAACGDPAEAPAPREGLQAVPYPELSASEPAVVRQLDGLRSDLEGLLQEPSTSRRALAEGFRRLGERYQAYDLVDAAAVCYRNARLLLPDSPRIDHLLGVLARREGNHEEAVDSLQRAIEGAPDNLAARLHLAFVELAMDRPGDAAARAHGVLEQDPDSAAAHVLLGQAAMAEDDAEAAIPAFERALELQPRATRLHYLLGQAHRKLRDLDAARRHLEMQGPSEVAFPDPIIASLYTDLAGSAAIMQRAASAKVAGFLEASVDSYRLAVANDPTSPEARRDLGALLAQTGKLEPSADQYREALRLEPDKALNHFSLALILEAMGNDDEALDNFRAAVDKEPDYREFRLVLAQRLAAQGQFEEARGHFDQLLERDPRDADSRLERAKVRAELGDAAGAEADARQVAQSDGPAPLRAQALQVEADLAARKGDRAAALRLLDQALALDPEQPEAHFSLGTLAGMSGDFAAAQGHFRRVTEATPERATAWLGEATALVLLGRESEAAERLEAGLEVLPNQGSLAFTLARLRLSAEDPTVRNGPRALELAESLFRAQATPEHAEVLALALDAVGRGDEAANLFRRLIDQLPPNSDPALGERWRAEIARLEAAGS